MRDSSEAGNVGDCGIPLLSVKEALSWSPLCVSGPEDESSAGSVALLLCANLDNGLCRLYGSSSSWCTAQLILVWMGQTVSACRASVLIANIYRGPMDAHRRLHRLLKLSNKDSLQFVLFVYSSSRERLLPPCLGTWNRRRVGSWVQLVISFTTSEMK